jgi:hypothetical protein
MPGRTLTFSLQSRNGTEERAVTVAACVVAGWTGRDQAALEHHIAELEAMGVKRPASTPIFYRVAAARLTTDAVIEVVGEASSGEVEPVVLQLGDGLWVGVGSDHTDREAETVGVTISKQLCDKPIAPVLWPHAEVAGHWDRLVLRSFAVSAGKRELYQEGALAAMLDPPALIGRYSPDGRLAEGTLMFGGTFAAKGGIRPAERFEFEIEDPVLGRTIRHGYAIATLPVAG